MAFLSRITRKFQAYSLICLPVNSLLAKVRNFGQKLFALYPGFVYFSRKRKIMQKGITTAVWFVGIIWAVFLLNYIFPFADFRNYGIRPRDIDGLIGIVLAPILHANFGHIISNSIPLFILSAALVAFYRNVWMQVMIFSALIGGVAVWLMARSGTNHIGASGVIFSLMAFLIMAGIFRRTFKAIIVGIIVFFLYGGSLIFGVIPSRPGISWEGHLFGALAGVFLAWVFRKTKEYKLK